MCWVIFPVLGLSLLLLGASSAFSRSSCSFCGVRSFVHVVLVVSLFCSRCLVESKTFVLVGCAWGVLLSFSCWCQTCERNRRGKPRNSIPSHQSACCPVCSVPVSFFCVVMHARAWPARACARCDGGPLTFPPTCLNLLSSCLQELFSLKLPYAACCSHPRHIFVLKITMADANVDAPAQAGAHHDIRQRVDDQGTAT